MKIILLFSFALFSCRTHVDALDKVRVIQIELNSKGNEIAFEQDYIHIPLGKRVKLTFKNKADRDSEITHNVAIIKPGKESKVLELLEKEEYDFTEAINFFKDTDYLLASSKIIEPQQSGELVVTLDEPGRYTFICLMPGHGNILHMKGIFFVKGLHANSFTTSEIKELKQEYKRNINIPFPKHNPFTKSKYKLGKKLFFDKRLSATGTISCATCHRPQLGLEDGKALSKGVTGKTLSRHTPTILNLAWSELFSWDGRSRSLEEQAKKPITDQLEMGLNETQFSKMIQSDQNYLRMFTKAFPGRPINIGLASHALATFERKLISTPSPFDEWIEGKEDAISSEAKRGFLLFNGKAHCSTCHSGWRFTDDSFHDIGIDSADIGRGKFLKKINSMQHAFKTPTLRNIALRSPYMHNGSKRTLKEVIDFYNRGGDKKRPSLSSEIFLLNLTSQEKRDLISFLKTLSSEVRIE